MKKCKDQINMDYSKLMQSPVSVIELQSFNDVFDKACSASYSYSSRVSFVTFLIIETVLLNSIFNATLATPDIVGYVTLSIFCSAMFAIILRNALYNDHLQSRCPAFKWDVKSRNKISFVNGIERLSDNEYIELKDLAEQNECIMNYVKTIASQGRQPIKAELCMLKNYMNQYPSSHAKQLLGLA